MSSAPTARAQESLGVVAPDRRAKLRRLAGPISTTGVIAATTLALHLRDPHQAGSWGRCAVYSWTGLYCPVCGGLRSVNDLTNGDILSAVSSNLVVALAAPMAVAALAIWSVDSWCGRTRTTTPRRADTYAVIFLAVLAVFTAARNLPIGNWLAP